MPNRRVRVEINEAALQQWARDNTKQISWDRELPFDEQVEQILASARAQGIELDRGYAEGLARGEG